ncbi:HK97 gp10 family phage protein [Streptomyces sp. TRM68367]|nr:HK97 gp10 family phage protein [Streptomyces sp. TRM68367]
MRARTRAITRHHAMLLRTRIQKNASGRPGPNVITGAYRASWEVKVTVSGGRVTATVFTEAPQARRLGYGFVGYDRLGRGPFRQPPYPHIEPFCGEGDTSGMESRYPAVCRQGLRPSTPRRLARAASPGRRS